jgi:flavorubredoxin
MLTLLEEEKVLFSQDAFGMHLATNKLFADELNDAILEYEAAKYFANILLPFASRVSKLIDKSAPLFNDLGMIIPDHGPLWRTHPMGIIDCYRRWSAQVPTNKAVVIYDTMWQSTATMARAVGDGLLEGGSHVKLLPLSATHRSDVATELLEAGALLVGSPTMNNNLFPTVADTLCYLKGLRPMNKLGAAFGSYGWGGEAVRQINVLLDEMKIERISEGIRVKYVPDEEALAQCFTLGREMADRLIKKCV